MRRLALVGSGTATLEAAFQGTPMAVLYRTSRLACRLAPHVLTVPWFCQVNLMAGRELVPELLLHEDDPGPVLAAAEPLLADGPARNAQQAALADFRKRHFRPGAIRRGAGMILDYLGL